MFFDCVDYRNTYIKNMALFSTTHKKDFSSYENEVYLKFLLLEIVMISFFNFRIIELSLKYYQILI